MPCNVFWTRTAFSDLDKRQLDAQEDRRVAKATTQMGLTESYKVSRISLNGERTGVGGYPGSQNSALSGSQKPHHASFLNDFCLRLLRDCSVVGETQGVLVRLGQQFNHKRQTQALKGSDLRETLIITAKDLGNCYTYDLEDVQQPHK